MNLDFPMRLFVGLQSFTFVWLYLCLLEKPWAQVGASTRLLSLVLSIPLELLSNCRRKERVFRDK